MGAPYDIDRQQIPDSITIKRGIAALLTTSAESEQKWYDAYMSELEEKEEWKSKCKVEKERADKAEAEVEYWKKLALQPRVILKDNAKADKIVTGNYNEIYGENNSIPGQQSLRQLSVG